MTDDRFSRRSMLGGLGVSMALPWLESLPVWGDEPSGRARQRAAGAPDLLFAGNGFHSTEWWVQWVAPTLRTKEGDLPS